MTTISNAARPSRRPLAVLAALAALLTFALARPAAAQSIAGHPGQHRDYTLEIEPHLDLGLGGHEYHDGWGGGVRFGVPVTRNGFIPSINNNVAIGFGLDYLRYSWDCGPYTDCPTGNRVWLPIVAQWNFFLAPQWSLFGELGLSLSHGWWSGGGTCYDYTRFGGPVAVDCSWGASSNDLDLIGAIGARWQFSREANMVLRLGWPYASLGVSFW